MKKLVGAVAGCFLFAATIGATDASATPEKMHGKSSCIECHKFSKEDAQKLFKKYDIEVESVRPHPSGFAYEVFFEAKKTKSKGLWYYVFSDKYFFGGNINDIEKQRPVFAHEDKIREAQQANKQKLDMSDLPKKLAVTIGNPSGKKQLYVFTDPDCPYCRQLHPILNKLAEEEKDVAIHIMLMPIPQLHPKAYDKSRAVLASKSKQVLDDAFAGKPVPDVGKDVYKKEVDEIMAYAQKSKINGTPTIYLGDGNMYSGGRTVDQLKAALK